MKEKAEDSESEMIAQYKKEYSEQWKLISSEIPNPDREKSEIYWDPGRRLLGTIRRYQYWQKKRGFFALLWKYKAVVSYRFWSVVAGCEIPLNTQIGIGLLLPHPYGIVVHPRSIIGVNCLLFQQVTLGMGGKKPGLPELGGHVDVGTGAKILGGIKIGNHVRIGANAVVLDDVPDNCVAVGIPAKIIPIKDI